MTETDAKTAKYRRSWYHAVAGGALALGLVAGLGSATAYAEPAQPADPTTAEDAAPQPMTAEQALAIIEQDYDTGAGGGQLSNLIHQVLQLRAQGVMPSNANKQAITEALDHRPNQGPLIKALTQTISDQQKKIRQMGGQAGPSQAVPWQPQDGWNPMTQDGDTIFPMPGR